MCRNKVNNINVPSFNIKLRKKQRQNFLKTVVFDHFGGLFAYFLAKRIFSKNYNTSVFRFLHLPSCTKAEKNQWVVINKNSQLAGRQIDRERYRQIDRQTDRQRWFHRIFRLRGFKNECIELFSSIRFSLFFYFWDRDKSRKFPHARKFWLYLTVLKNCLVI